MPEFERGSGERPALSRLVGADTARVFGATYWSRQPFLAAAVSNASFDDLFSSAAVDELVRERGIRTPFMRMAVEGSVLSPSTYTAPGGFGAEVADQVNSEKVLAEFAAGATIVLQGLHRTWPPLIDFTRRLVDDLGHPAQVNAYVTPASSRGFDPHYDVHDVFVLQISGEKHWRIHAPVHPHPLRDQPWSDYREQVAAQAAGEPVIDTVLRPGDVLYLPRGWIHSAEALGGTSVHLTIGVAAYTQADIAHSLLTVIADTPALRESLPLGVDFGDTEQLLPIVAEVLAGLQGALQIPDARAAAVRQASAVGADLSHRLSGASRPEPVSPLATVDFIGTLNEASTVRWRGSLRAAITTGPESVRIALAGRSVVLPQEAQPAVEMLHAGQAVAVGELPGLDPASAIVVVRRLLREGIVVPA
ncbi:MULTISPECIES: cupin domain-containing protein [Subtercola]|uniref:Cupin n=1 Tax=Subtercola vilae TaxID=2056433 RepID=A0A4T2BZE0_9MICO|nr:MULTISPECIES: cupin domain-containing protein [Subtercola]MEA9986363.1 cupin domain-containing protein [Subtercola sp. RTI3]TIH34998.1 cupin [Subtercola vilae]